MMPAKLRLFLGLMGIAILNFAQTDTTLVSKPIEKHKVFAHIFTAAYYNFESKKPNAGFELATGLLGYQYQKNDQLKLTIMYDVTRTTNAILVNDSNGTIQTVNYFEGSKYTAFLKMAEINWAFHPQWSLAVGQLLNEQYLTLQDKFWNHRYVMVTMQEYYRMGNPADFGFRVKYQNKKLGQISLGAVNGDGPFKHQDNYSLVEYTANAEWTSVPNLTIKAFTAYTPTLGQYTADYKLASTLFAAYRTTKLTLGIEYAWIENANYFNVNYSGLSGFGAYLVHPKWEVFARYDYINQALNTQSENMALAGVQYQPESNLVMALNFRTFWPSQIHQLYFSFGAKF